MKKSIAIMLICGIMLQCFFCSLGDAAAAVDQNKCKQVNYYSGDLDDLLVGLNSNYVNRIYEYIEEYEYYYFIKDGYNLYSFFTYYPYGVFSGLNGWCSDSNLVNNYVYITGYQTSYDNIKLSKFKVCHYIDGSYVYTMNSNDSIFWDSKDANLMVVGSNVRNVHYGKFSSDYADKYYYYKTGLRLCMASLFPADYGLEAAENYQWYFSHDVVDWYTGDTVAWAHDNVVLNDYSHSVQVVGLKPYLCFSLVDPDRNLSNVSITYSRSEDEEPVTESFDFITYSDEEYTYVRVELSELVRGGPVYIKGSSCIEKFGYPMVCNDEVFVTKNSDGSITAGNAFDNTPESNDSEVSRPPQLNIQSGESVNVVNGRLDYDFPEGSHVLFIYLGDDSSSIPYDPLFGFFGSYIRGLVSSDVDIDDIVSKYADQYDYIVVLDTPYTSGNVFELEGGLQRRTLLNLVDGWEWLADALQAAADQNATLYKMLYNQYTSFYNQFNDMLDDLTDLLNGLDSHFNNFDMAMELLYGRLDAVIEAINNIELSISGGSDDTEPEDPDNPDMPDTYPDGPANEEEAKESIWDWLLSLLKDIFNNLLDIFGNVIMFLIDILREAFGAVAGLFGYYEDFEALFDDEDSILHYFSSDDSDKSELMSDVGTYFDFVRAALSALPEPLYAFMIISCVITLGMIIIRRI